MKVVQQVIWVLYVHVSNFASGGKHVPVTLARKPDRVWTLRTPNVETMRPPLPLAPVHNENAFLEDEMHDWNWDALTNHLRYYGRTHQSVWVLVENIEYEKDDLVRVRWKGKTLPGKVVNVSKKGLITVDLDGNRLRFRPNGWGTGRWGVGNQPHLEKHFPSS